MPVAGSASFGGDGTDLGADFPVRGNIFDIFIILYEYPRRRRRPCRPETAAHQPEPQGIRPLTRRRQKGRPGSGARGSAMPRSWGRSRPTIPRPGNDARKRACRIGVGAQMFWVPMTPIRSPKSASTSQNRTPFSISAASSSLGM